MKAAELIERLQQVSPETDIKVGTTNGTYPVRDLWTLGYDGGTAILIADD